MYPDQVQLLERLRKAEEELTYLTNSIIVREALDIARFRKSGETEDDVIARLLRCGDDWYSLCILLEQNSINSDLFVYVS